MWLQQCWYEVKQHLYVCIALLIIYTTIPRYNGFDVRGFHVLRCAKMQYAEMQMSFESCDARRQVEFQSTPHKTNL